MSATVIPSDREAEDIRQGKATPYDAEPNGAAFARDARHIVGDLFEHKAWIYWLDMLITVAIGYGGAVIYLSPAFSWFVRIPAFLIGGAALFRAGSYIHEIAHLNKGEMISFHVGWNICCGIPMLMPSVLYFCHIDHHNVKHYGTAKDGEYLPFGAGPVWHILAYMGETFIIPILTMFRFLFLVPLSFCSKRIREWLLWRYSAYVLNPWYRWTPPADGARRAWALLDALCSIRAWAMILFILILPAGYHWTRLPLLYVLSVYVIGLNWTRNLAAHTYTNRGEEMSYFGQLVDSVNIEGRPLLTEILFPLGLRYHALHHLMPGLPYHSLGTAHRRLMAQLPPDHPYRGTVHHSFLSVMKQLFANARASQKESREIAV